MQEAVELLVCGTQRSYTVAPDTRVTIGRADDCEIVLADQAVSQRHCTIERRGGELIVTDLQSANGTFLNGRLVSRATAGIGDTISIAGVDLLVREPVPPVPHPHRPPDRPALSSGDQDRPLESVISKRFEPSRFEWLTTLSAAADTRAADLQLLQRAQRHLASLHRMSEVLASAANPKDLAESTLDAILDVTGAERAAFVLRRTDPDTGGVEVAGARERVSNGRFIVSRTLVADVIEKGVSIFAHDAINDARFSGGTAVAAQQVRAVMCVPLRTTADILGALYVDTISAPGRFSEADLELLAALGNQAGVALHRVRLMGELERLLLDTIRAIAATIDAKDGYTHRHSERVAALARRIAEEVGLSPQDQQTVHLAALLHDVGKIAVPDSILNKPGRLTTVEFEEMQKHPVHGARILANIQSPVVTAVLPGVQYHHERWDGSGYPEGLRGEDIPLLGRILAIADFYDAITSARAYRPGLPPEEALPLIERGAGTHFDPRLVQAVLALHKRGDLLPEGWNDAVFGGPARSGEAAGHSAGGGALQQ